MQFTVRKGPSRHLAVGTCPAGLFLLLPRVGGECWPSAGQLCIPHGILPSPSEPLQKGVAKRRGDESTTEPNIRFHLHPESFQLIQDVHDEWGGEGSQSPQKVYPLSSLPRGTIMGHAIVLYLHTVNRKVCVYTLSINLNTVFALS